MLCLKEKRRYDVVATCELEVEEDCGEEKSDTLPQRCMSQKDIVYLLHVHNMILICARSQE